MSLTGGCVKVVTARLHLRRRLSARHAICPERLHCRLLDISDLPIFNEDLQGRVESWTRFRAQVKDCDAILLVTPEYNRSVPACLKNALDVGSRPQGQNVWDSKPTAVVSVTP